MQRYSFHDDGQIRHILADCKDGFLVWPGTSIPFFHEQVLASYPQKKTIEELVSEAREDEGALEELWQSEEIRALFLREADAI